MILSIRTATYRTIIYNEQKPFYRRKAVKGLDHFVMSTVTLSETENNSVSFDTTGRTP